MSHMEPLLTENSASNVMKQVLESHRHELCDYLWRNISGACCYFRNRGSLSNMLLQHILSLDTGVGALKLLDHLRDADNGWLHLLEYLETEGYGSLAKEMQQKLTGAEPAFPVTAATDTGTPDAILETDQFKELHDLSKGKVECSGSLAISYCAGHCLSPIEYIGAGAKDDGYVGLEKKMQEKNTDAETFPVTAATDAGTPIENLVVAGADGAMVDRHSFPTALAPLVSIALVSFGLVAIAVRIIKPDQLPSIFTNFVYGTLVLLGTISMGILLWKIYSVQEFVCRKWLTFSCGIGTALGCISALFTILLTIIYYLNTSTCSRMVCRNFFCPLAIGLFVVPGTIILNVGKSRLSALYATYNWTLYLFRSALCVCAATALNILGYSLLTMGFEDYCTTLRMLNMSDVPHHCRWTMNYCTAFTFSWVPFLLLPILALFCMQVATKAITWYRRREIKRQGKRIPWSGLIPGLLLIPSGFIYIGTYIYLFYTLWSQMTLDVGIARPIVFGILLEWSEICVKVVGLLSASVVIVKTRSVSTVATKNSKRSFELSLVQICYIGVVLYVAVNISAHDRPSAYITKLQQGFVLGSDLIDWADSSLQVFLVRRLSEKYKRHSINKRMVRWPIYILVLENISFCIVYMIRHTKIHRSPHAISYYSLEFRVIFLYTVVPIMAYFRLLLSKLYIHYIKICIINEDHCSATHVDCIRSTSTEATSTTDSEISTSGLLEKA